MKHCWSGRVSGGLWSYEMLKRHPQYPDRRYLYERWGKPYYYRRVPADVVHIVGKLCWTDALGEPGAYDQRHAEVEREIKTARKQVKDERAEVIVKALDLTRKQEQAVKDGRMTHAECGIPPLLAMLVLHGAQIKKRREAIRAVRSRRIW